MSQKKDRRLAFKERVNAVKEYISKYQTVLRSLKTQLPDDEEIEPFFVSTAIGRIDIYSCKDAAVILTYPETSPELEIKIKDPIDKTGIDFLKASSIFTYFDENGNPSSIRLSLGEPKDTNFLYKKINIDDVIAWARDLNKGKKDYNVHSFFKPKFKRLSVLGWESSLSNPIRDVTEEIQKAYAFSNILKSNDDEIESKKRQRFIETSNQRVKDFDDFLKVYPSTDSIRDYIENYPEIINPSFLRCYRNFQIDDQKIADFLLFVWDEKLKCLVVNLADMNAEFFDTNSQPTEIFLSEKDKILELGKLLLNHPNLPIALSNDCVIEHHLVMGRTSKLNYLQKSKLKKEEIKSIYINTYDDLINRFTYHFKDIASIWDQYEPIQLRLERLGLFNSDEFNRAMEMIDREMIAENIPITARQIEAWLRFSSAFSLFLVNQDPLTTRIYEWFDIKYGDALKIDPTFKIAALIKNEFYRLRVPLCYGTIDFICSPEKHGTTSETIVSSGDTPPICNVLDLIDDFSEEKVKLLSKEELLDIFNQFQLGLEVKESLDQILRENKFVFNTKENLQNCVIHLVGTPIECKSLGTELILAIENLLKAFIIQNDGEIEKSELIQLIQKAESFGLREIPQVAIKRIKGLLEFDFNSSANSIQESFYCYQLGLDICIGLSKQIFLTKNYKQVTELCPNNYYTNFLGKMYKCIKIDGNMAEIMLFDELLGNTLEVLFTQHQDYWNQYYLIEDQNIITAFEKRYKLLRKNGQNQQNSK